MQYQTSGYGVTNMVASRFPGDLIKVAGYFRGTSDAWLQLHDAAQLPANGAVPLKSYFQPSGSPFSWGFDPTTLGFSKGVIVAISTTEATLTISTDVADFFVDGFSANHVAGTSVVGDLTTARETLDLFTTPKVLYKVDVNVVVDEDTYIQLYDKNIADLNANSKPIGMFFHKAGANNSKFTFCFGAGGVLLAKACIVSSLIGTGYNPQGTNDLVIQGVYL